MDANCNTEALNPSFLLILHATKERFLPSRPDHVNMLPHSASVQLWLMERDVHEVEHGA